MMRWPVLQKFFKDRFYCGLDIGASRIKACLSRAKDVENLEILAVHEVETRGIRGDSVNDIGQASAAVGEALEMLARRTKIRFSDVYLGVGGDMVDIRMSRAVIPLVERGNKMIVPADIRAARKQARLLGVRIDEEVVTDLVRHFKVDDVGIANDPIGLYGRKLEVEVFLVVMNNTRMRNLTRVVRQAGYEIGRIVFNMEALAEAVVERQDRVEGCVLVDLGAERTDILVFKDGLLKHFSRALFGGGRLTRMLSKEMGLPLDLAEDIKKTYGRVGASGHPGAPEEVLVKREEGFVPLQRSTIDGIIEQDVRELIRHIQDSVAASGQEGQIKRGIVMSGGGAILTGLMERIEDAVGLPVVMARNIPGLNNSALYSVATSLAEMGYRGGLRYLFDSRKPKDWVDLVRGRVENFFNEYF